MADTVVQKRTELSGEDVMIRAVQFFATANWRPTSQTSRSATFQGKPPIPWFMMLLTIAGFAMCILPGVILYFMVLRKMYRFHNLVITANPISGGSEIVIQHPASAKSLVHKFVETLPELPTET